jgi:hypothetical protein
MWYGRRHIFFRHYCTYECFFARRSDNLHCVQPPCVVALIALAQKVACVAISESTKYMSKMMVHTMFGYTTTSNGWKQTLQLQRSNFEDRFWIFVYSGDFIAKNTFFQMALARADDVPIPDSDSASDELFVCEELSAHSWNMFTVEYRNSGFWQTCFRLDMQTNIF